MVSPMPRTPSLLVVALTLACGSGNEAPPSSAPPPPSTEAPVPPATEAPAPTVVEPEVATASTTPLPAADAEPVVPGAFLTEGDAPVASARVGGTAHGRMEVVAHAIGAPARPVASAVHALPDEQFLFTDAHRLTLVDAASGNVRGTRVVDDDLQIDPNSVSVDTSGRHVCFHRSDRHVCSWDTDLDRIDCTPGTHGRIAPGGGHLFVVGRDANGPALVRFVVAGGGRHEIVGLPADQPGRIAAISPSEQRIVLSGRTGLDLVNAADGTRVKSLGDEVLPQDAFRPQGGTWVTYGHGFLAFRDTLDGSLRHAEPLPFVPTRVFWNADGTALVVLGRDAQGAHVARFDGTTGAPAEAPTLTATTSDRFTPGFHPDGTFDFYEENEVPSRSGRYALRVDWSGMRVRDLQRARVVVERRGVVEDEPFLDVVSDEGSLALVTPFSVVRLSGTGLTQDDLGLFGASDDDDDDLTSAYDESGLLAVGNGTFVERRHGTVYRGTAASDDDDAITCDGSHGIACCQLRGSRDERADADVLRTLDHVRRASTPPIDVELAHCGHDDCPAGQQCAAPHCTASVVHASDDSCLLSSHEEPRFSATGNVVVTALPDGSVEAFDTASGSRLGAIAHAGGVSNQAWDVSADGTLVAFARGDTLRLHDPGGPVHGTATGHLPHPARWIRFQDDGSLVAGLVEGSVVWIDGTTLAISGTMARDGLRAETPSRHDFVACVEGTLRWTTHAPGTRSADGRDLGPCDRDSRVVISSDQRFVVELAGARARVHRAEGGPTLVVQSGRTTIRHHADAPGTTTPWALVTDEQGHLELVGGAEHTFVLRTDRVRHGAIRAVADEDMQPGLAASLFAAP